jgi:hypothetical protein
MMFHNHFDRPAWQEVRCYTPMGECKGGFGCQRAFSCTPKPSPTERALKYINDGNEKPTSTTGAFFRHKVSSQSSHAFDSSWSPPPPTRTCACVYHRRGLLMLTCVDIGDRDDET